MDLEQMVFKAQQGNQQAFEELYTRFRGLVMAHARKGYLQRMRDEALSEGLVGLVEAIQTYNLVKKVRFPGYADACIRYRLWNLFKREKRRWQNETSDAAGQEAECAEVEWPDPAVDVEAEVLNQLYLAGLLPQLSAALAALPERQYYVIRRHVLEQASSKEIAAELGVTVQAVWNLKKRAIARLKKVTSGMYKGERR